MKKSRKILGEYSSLLHHVAMSNQVQVYASSSPRRKKLEFIGREAARIPVSTANW
jgi:hypothetical protein